ncbi:AAA family ATPase [Megasphaera elsdenii]|uniref:AAA family ATPase n=1 Tax=Megasphaera elsdenii TaxID=907 RepID=UPI002432165A|nr:AAA family ATPase [Megasphaera elsdenii]
MQKKMPIGVSDFKQLREKNYYFVDKTDFIRQLIDNHSAVTLITRPRRFGKTLTMSMLKYFFSIQQESVSKKLFAGLAIERAGANYQQERGQYPVIFLSLKDFSMNSWAEMLEGWRDFLAGLFLEHTVVRDAKRVQPELIERFQKLAEGKADAVAMSSSLALLMRMMHQYYRRPVLVLIDEYDAPIQQAWSKGFYDPCITFLRQFLSSALKDNPDLDFAVLTGVLRVAKESIFSGLNNFDVCTVLGETYADVFGFTAEEVTKMAKDMQMEAALPKIQRWYDGYRFGQKDIYNPWSVVNFFRYHELADYWVNTSGNVIIQALLSHDSREQDTALLSLLHGETVTAAIREGVIYEDIERDNDTLFTMLLTTGYLTTVSKQRGISGLLCDLVIPNREVRDVYRAEIIDRVKSGLSAAHLEKMMMDLLNGQAKAFSDGLSKYLRYYISAFDTANKESFYHGLLLGMTALLVPTYVVDSNRESGLGRFDLAIFPKDTKKAGVIMEFKVADSENELKTKAAEALAQIESRQYITEFHKHGITNVWKYGIAFFGKQVCILG